MAPTLTSETRCLLRVIGVGNAGTNIVDLMERRRDVAGAELAVVNSDEPALARSTVATRFCLGATMMRGLGAGGDPDHGCAAAEADVACLKALCAESRIVCIVAGLGGGVGTGAAPVLSRLARENGSLVLGVAIEPFGFEGSLRRANADQGLRDFCANADVVLRLPAHLLIQSLDSRTPAQEAFNMVNDLVAQAVTGLWRLLTRPGLVALDFAHLERFVRAGRAQGTFGIVETTGEMRSHCAVEKLAANPLLTVAGGLAEADSALVGISGGSDLELGEIERITKELQRRFNDRCEVVVGTSIDPALNGRLQVALMLLRRVELDSVPTGIANGGRQTGGMSPVLAKGSVAAVRAGEHHPKPNGPPEKVLEAGSAGVMREGQLSQRDSGKEKRTGSRGGFLRRRGVQQELGLFNAPRDRFENTPATIHGNQDLDEPTFLRRNIVLN